MTLIDTLFSNAFFQLPMLEGLMYVAVVLLIGAAIVGLWDRLWASSKAQSQTTESYEFRKAA